MATPRILELPLEGPRPAPWVLWFLRTRTDPSTRGGGRGQDRTGQELILTENTAVCRGRLLEAARGPAPHQPHHPQVHLTLESSDTGWRVRAQGGTLDGGGREAACRSRPDCGRKGKASCSSLAARAGPFPLTIPDSHQAQTRSPQPAHRGLGFWTRADPASAGFSLPSRLHLASRATQVSSI